MYITHGKNELTIEHIGESIHLNKSEIDLISQNLVPNEEEAIYYDSIEKELDEIYSKEIELAPTTRKIVYSGKECITTISLLLYRHVNSMTVYMRSSDTRKLPSDLGFLCRLALKYNVDIVTIMFGSYHTVLYRQFETTRDVRWQLHNTNSITVDRGDYSITVDQGDL